MSSHPITEDDLHGFVDHLLDSARRSEVQTYLDAHPEIAAQPELNEATLHKLLAAAALVTRPMRDVADLVPDMHAAIGGWSN